MTRVWGPEAHGLHVRCWGDIPLSGVTDEATQVPTSPCVVDIMLFGHLSSQPSQPPRRAETLKDPQNTSSGLIGEGLV